MIITWRELGAYNNFSKNVKEFIQYLSFRNLLHQRKLFYLLLAILMYPLPTPEWLTSEPFT